MAECLSKTDELGKEGLLRERVHKTITRQEAEQIVCRLSAHEKVMLNELLKGLEQKR